MKIQWKFLDWLSSSRVSTSSSINCDQRGRAKEKHVCFFGSHVGRGRYSRMKVGPDHQGHPQHLEILTSELSPRGASTEMKTTTTSNGGEPKRESPSLRESRGLTQAKEAQRVWGRPRVLLYCLLATRVSVGKAWLVGRPACWSFCLVYTSGDTYFSRLSLTLGWGII